MSRMIESEGEFYKVEKSANEGKAKMSRAKQAMGRPEARSCDKREARSWKPEQSC